MNNESVESSNSVKRQKTGKIIHNGKEVIPEQCKGDISKPTFINKVIMLFILINVFGGISFINGIGLYKFSSWLQVYSTAGMGIISTVGSLIWFIIWLYLYIKVNQYSKAGSGSQGPETAALMFFGPLQPFICFIAFWINWLINYYFI